MKRRGTRRRLQPDRMKRYPVDSWQQYGWRTEVAVSFVPIARMDEFVRHMHRAFQRFGMLYTI